MLLVCHCGLGKIIFWLSPTLGDITSALKAWLCYILSLLKVISGGGGGIRTHGPLAGTTVFKIVQERLGHSTVAITLDTYSHVAPGLQEAAANRFDEVIIKHTKEETVAIS